MGLFSVIKQKLTGTPWKKFAPSLTGYSPIFSQWGGNAYNDVAVQQALNCIVREMKKLEPRHVKKDENGDYIPQLDRIQYVLDHPNPLMTTTDFIEKIIWNLFFNYNSFIIPVWNNNNELEGLYPVQPTQVDFIQDNSNQLFVKLRFANLYEATVKYDDIIHIRYNFSVSDYMGGDVNGQPNYQQLNETLELNHTMLEGVGKALKSSFAINGIVRYNTLIDEKKQEENIRQLTEALKRNESGLMGLDLKGEFIPFNRQIKMVDADTLKFIDEKILRNFGVPLCILTGDYTVEQYESFYQKTIEPLVISLSQAFSKCLFSTREYRGFGHRILFYTKELVFMSTAQKIEMVKLLGDRGQLYDNEARTILGLKPLPELVGKRTMSLNYIDADKATEYQLQSKSTNIYNNSSDTNVAKTSVMEEEDENKKTL